MRRSWWLSACATMATIFEPCAMKIGWNPPSSRKQGAAGGQQRCGGPRRFSSARISALRLASAARAQGRRMGLARSASGSVGCFPVRRKALLLMLGYLGSAMIGPGPEAGGLKPPRTTTQPTEGLGAKFGAGAGVWDAGAAERAVAESRLRIMENAAVRDTANLLTRGSVRHPGGGGKWASGEWRIETIRLRRAA